MPDTDTPRLGIFWRVPDDDGSQALVVDSEPLANSEIYGDMRTHPRGHYEVWETWRRLGSAGLKARGLPGAIALAGYEVFPRGRVVYSTLDRRYIIYADRRLQAPEMIAEIRRRLGLVSETCVVMSDSHYR